MSQELPDGVEREAFEKRMFDFGWRNFTGGMEGSPPFWCYANSDLNARWIGWREASAILADREKQAARVPEGCPTCKRTDGNVCDWCPSVAAPTEPSKPEQAEGVSDDELNELARQHTWFNGSHAMTNYPAFARAAIARWGATTPPASAAGEPEAWDAQRAYHEGRAAYEASVGHFREGKHKLFWELTSIQQAEFVARAALASKPVAPPEREAPSIGQIIEVAESWQRGFMCPLCGHDQPHEHSPREITIYRNGVKWGLKNGTEQWPWKGYPSPSKNAGHDSKGVGRQGGHGTDQHHEHRVGQSGSDRAHDQSTGRRDGIHGACDVSAKVDTTPPASAAGEQKPVAFVDERAISWLASRINAKTAHITTRLSKEKSFERPLALYAAPLPEQVAQDKEHAENYRLIRRGQHWSVVDGIGNTLRGDDLDAAVAAIRAARTRGEGGGT